MARARGSVGASVARLSGGMATKEIYKQISSEIEKRGGFTTLRNDEYGGYSLLCASRMNDDATLGGNSFWIWFNHQSSAWFLSTWSPCHYVIPSSVDVVEVCVQCLFLSDSAMPSLPDAIIAKFNLGQLSETDFDSLYEA